MTHSTRFVSRRGFVIGKMRLGMVLGGLGVIAACLAIRGKLGNGVGAVPIVHHARPCGARRRRPVS